MKFYPVFLLVLLTGCYYEDPIESYPRPVYPENLLDGWEIVSSGNPDFKEIIIIADGDLVIAKSQSGYFRSEDSCKTWTAIDDFIDLRMLDESEGYATKIVGDINDDLPPDIQILKTTDGCRSFRRVKTFKFGFLSQKSRIALTSDSLHISYDVCDSLWAIIETRNVSYTLDFRDSFVRTNPHYFLDCQESRGDYLFKIEHKNGSAIVRRYFKGVVDSVSFDLNSFYPDLRSFDITDFNNVHVLSGMEVRSYNFSDKTFNQKPNPLNSLGHLWLAYESDSQHYFLSYLHHVYNVTSVEHDTSIHIMRYDYRHLEEWSDFDIIKLKLLHNHSHLYVFLNDRDGGLVWRKKI